MTRERAVPYTRILQPLRPSGTVLEATWGNNDGNPLLVNQENLLLCSVIVSCVLTRSPNWRHKGSASWRKKTKRHVASKKAQKAYKAGTCPNCMALIGPSCLAGPTKGEEELQLEEEEGLRPLASRGKDHREPRMNQKAKKYIHSQLEATDHVKASKLVCVKV